MCRLLPAALRSDTLGTLFGEKTNVLPLVSACASGLSGGIGSGRGVAFGSLGTHELPPA